MAANRYGQIWHGNHHHINIRFPSNEARLKFQNEFEAYHASHDHDGDIPTFINVTSKDLKLSTGSRSPQDLVKAEEDAAYRITIDGYSWNEIHDYHNPRGFSDYFHYHVPTCCVPPIIVVDREFVDSGTLQRHELSAIFGDMPADDFQSLIESVQTDGFIDPIIRIHEGHILDGWHRYRAAQELNLIRRLKFQEWNEDEKKDGDPKAFVLARNIERRHLSPQQRGQIVVAFNNRFGRGVDPRSLNSPNGEFKSEQEDKPKTRQELAAEAGVGTSTIDRAVAVDKAGESQAVISGEKTASEVLLEENRRKAQARAERERRALWDVYGKDERFGEIDDPEGLAVAASKAIGISEMEGLFIYDAGKDEIDKLSLEAAETWVQRFRQIRRDIEAGATWVVAYQIESAKIGHSNARLAVQSAVFDTGIHELMTDFEPTETGKKLNAFLTLIVEEKGLRLNIFSDGFYHKTGDAFEETHPEMYRGRDLDLSEIQGEIEILRQIAKDIRFYMKGGEFHMGWLDQVFQQLKSPGAVAPEPDSEVEDTVDSLWEQITPAISAWKSERKGQGVGYASKTMFISATKRFHDLPQESETDVDLLQKLLDLLTELHGSMYTFERYVKMQCDGASIWGTDETADAPESDSEEQTLTENESESESTPTSEPEEPDYEQLQREHVNRLEALPGEIRDYLPTWTREQAIEGNITLKLLLNARCQLKFGRERGSDPFFREELEDVLQWMQSNDADFARKVCELIGSSENGEVDTLNTDAEETSHNDLVALAESLIEDFDAHFEALGSVGEEAYMELFEKASLHYSFDLTHFLYVTNMYDSADYKEAGAFWESLTVPHRHAWMSTLMSMQRDLKNRENWAKGIGEVSESEVSDTETFDWKSVRPDFDPEKHEWLKVVIQRGKNHTTVTKIPMGPGQFSYAETEKEVVIPIGLFSVKELTEFAAELSEIFAKWVADRSKPSSQEADGKETTDN